MFLLRGIAVSLTFFVLIYSLLSGMVAIFWRSLRLFRVSARRLSTLLLALRIAPLTISVAVTCAFVIPSFQILEPRSTDEGTGTLPLAFGFCALALIACGCYRVITAQLATSRIVSRWLEKAQPYDGVSNHAVAFHPVTLLAGRDTPPLTLAGIRRAQVLVSESALAVLDREELHMALEHELAHLHSHDNLKKLIFRFCPFPGMSHLERAWSHAAELAADDAAVSSEANATDLASALVKLSRIAPVEPAPICTTGFVSGSISDRVSRLLAWNTESGAIASGTNGFAKSRIWLVIPFAAAFFCVGVTYGQVLSFTHELTEWLVH
jgi:Zn-dependent protease with chaperone function